MIKHSLKLTPKYEQLLTLQAKSQGLTPEAYLQHLVQQSSRKHLSRRHHRLTCVLTRNQELYRRLS